LHKKKKKKKKKKKIIKNCNENGAWIDAPLASLMDSIVNPKVKTTKKNKKLEHTL
jgi:hypothetical protein